MKLPLEWAQSYAPLAASPTEFADAITMSGSKVETWESEADHMKNVVVGKIEKLERHPDSDHLWVCQVNVGAETVQIVTGAQNLQEGDICPAALHGAKLPNGMEIKRGKLRGVESNGMLCSLGELGLTLHDFPDATEDGILVLAPQDGPYTLGEDAAKALGMDGVTFEFEITPNRPDCLSVLGLAREAAATFAVPFDEPTAMLPIPGEGAGKISDHLAVAVAATDTCMRYSAAMVENVRIKPSPRWLRQRLRQAGVRPINNIVDITNYVMLEYGQPMHAFDFAYVNGGKITVRKAKAGESIVTLDDVTRTLDETMMVIADEKGPIAIAGVMGGEYSGVYDTTQKVVFESASFNGPSVRATSRKIGLRTESSTRFEKGLDPNTAGPALLRALELVVELDAGDVMEGILDDYPNPREPRTLPLNPAAINRLLGIEVEKGKMVDILTPLGFEVENDVITIPTWRADVSRDCDIAEEVVRFVGYNKVPSTIMRGAAQARPTEKQVFERACTEVLTGCGLWQCQTFGFYSPAGFDKIRLPENSPLRSAVKLINPLGEETSIMRTTALPSILEVGARNWAARAAECAVFELATTYRPRTPGEPLGETDLPGDEVLPKESRRIVMAAYGGDWDYLAVKGVAEALTQMAGARIKAVVRNEEGTTFHPGRCAEIWLEDPADKTGEGLLLGTIGEVHPATAANYEVKARIVAADLSLEALFAARGGTPQYRHLPRFPASTRDLALVMDERKPALEVANIIESAAGKRLESLTLFDIYTGPGLGEGKKSLAYNLVLRDKEATLTDADADAIISKVLAKLEKDGVVLRS